MLFYKVNKLVNLTLYVCFFLLYVPKNAYSHSFSAENIIEFDNFAQANRLVYFQSLIHRNLENQSFTAMWASEIPLSLSQSPQLTLQQINSQLRLISAINH